MHFFLRKTKLPDSLSPGGNLSTGYRFIAVLTIVCFALGLGGCESFFEGLKPKSEHKSKTEKKPREKKSREDYDEIYLPGQTGSRLQRRMYVEKIPDRSADKKTKSASKKPASTPKPKAEPTPEAESRPTPKPEEETTPTPAERFR